MTKVLQFKPAPDTSPIDKTVESACSAVLKTIKFFNQHLDALLESAGPDEKIGVATALLCRAYLEIRSLDGLSTNGMTFTLDDTEALFDGLISRIIKEDDHASR